MSAFFTLVFLMPILAHGQLIKELDVLFIGNSYTYYHEMPSLVQFLAIDAGHMLNFVQRTEGGWSWEMVII